MPGFILRTFPQDLFADKSLLWKLSSESPCKGKNVFCSSCDVAAPGHYQAGLDLMSCFILFLWHLSKGNSVTLALLCRPDHQDVGIKLGGSLTGGLWARGVGHRGNKKCQARIKGNECVVNRIFLKKKHPWNHSEKAFSLMKILYRENKGL